MDIIRDIAKLSEYQPSSGELLELYKIAMDPMLNREQAMIEFQKSPSHFRNTYKELKDRLLDGILQNSFSSYSKAQQIRISVWKKYAEVMILFRLGENKTATKIAKEVLGLAEKYGMLSIVLDLSRKLEIGYANLGDPKYHKIQQKVVEFSRLLSEEQKIFSLHCALVYRVRKKQNWKGLIGEIKALDKLLLNNTQEKFRYIYYSLRNLLFQLEEDSEGLINNSEAAVAFFDSYPTQLPRLYKWGFLFFIFPAHIAQGNFVKAEEIIQRCLDLPIKGSYNWHLTQQYFAIWGFHSHNITRIQDTLIKVNKAPKKFKSGLIDARWKIIKAYLALFQEAEVLTEVHSFRLYRFLNEMNAVKNDSLKMNVFILELLHLLAKGNHTQYLARTQSIESYISKNVKGKEKARTKYFLRMLRSVIKGGYHPVRVAAHAKKNKTRLVQTPTSTNMHLLDTEVVPYEVLWDLVLVFLAKSRGKGA